MEELVLSKHKTRVRFSLDAPQLRLAPGLAFGLVG